ncbi:AAA family ATPase [Halobacillus sp. K22]|uniref:AAA family ATPase n=1 Tax=Halobacillus sp. K22 TaxID=3457431 RepID=UPI003FCDD735
MRAITLTVQAFGPYREQQIIDFSSLGEEAIFLITGPTGAGKTTIFDAMCFALYGRASGSDRDQDSMRSHFAQEGEPTYVDFLFELRGKFYRIVRMPKQVRRKERGEGWKEEPARAELYMTHLENEKLLATKVKEVNDYIEEVLGLDYDQFRKMIMIPQGEFRKLISENSKEREDILQKIFKTQFYSELTDYLKNQSKTLEKEIEQFQWKIEQEVSKIHWGTEEEVSLKEEEPQKILDRLSKRMDQQNNLINQEQSHLNQLTSSADKLQSQLHEAKQLQEQFNEQQRLLEEDKVLKSRESTINTVQEELKWARQADEVKGFEQQWKDREEERKTAEIDQESKAQHRIRTEAEFSNVEKEYRELEEKEDKRQALKKEWEQKEEERKKLIDFLTLDSQLTEINQKLTKSKEQVVTLEQELKQLKTERNHLKDIIKNEREITDQIYKTKNQVEHLTKQLKDLKRLSKEWDVLIEMRTSYQQFMKDFKQVEKEHHAAKSHYESALEDIREHHAYTLSLQLEEGSPCPVCGNSHHPQPAIQPAQVVSQDRLTHLKQDAAEKHKAFQRMQEEAVQVKSKGETQRQMTDALFEEYKTVVGSMDQSSIQSAVKQNEQSLNSKNELLEDLNRQAKEMEHSVKKLENIEKREEELNRKLEKAKHDLNISYQEQTRLQTQKESFQENYSFETKDPQQLRKVTEQAEASYKEEMKKWENIQSQYSKLRDQLQQAKVSEEEGNKYVKQAQQAEKVRKEKFNQTLVQFQFSSVESYQNSLLSKEAIEEKQEMVEQYKQQKAIIQERLHSLNEKLDKKQKPDLDALHTEWEEEKQKLIKQQQLVNELELALSQNKQVHTNMAALLAEQGDLAQAYYDMAELAQLSRGDNHLRLSLERYVLAAFLDEIIVQANVRLDQMTDHRYQLVRSDALAKRGAQSGLDLEVIDHHTGQKRSVRTLSGGEGFKASLSLALGMADVVQSHAGGVQLDTLFIDEGFGTLDEVSLEQAIDCLRSLQDGNRMLGIISHVPQLKEEIPAKLQIQTGPAGSSVEFVFQ